MGAEIVIGGLVSAGVFYVWGWRRFRSLAAYWRNQKRSDQFERSLRDARDAMTGACPFRAATADDAELVAMLDVAKPDADALAACGFTPLGEVVAQAAEQPVNAVMRAFADPARTTCAVIMIADTSPTLVRLWLRTFEAGEWFSTVRGAQPTLAEPPFAHRQMFDTDLSHAELVVRHRTFARLGDARAFAPIATLDDLLAALATSHASIARWRLAQPPDELLEADLRAALGKYYARLGKIWARRLRAPLPEATLRRR